MKIIWIYILIVAACWFPQRVENTSGKILIVYLSRTNNTRTIAEIIHQKTGGDLVALELETPYPEDYDAIVAQVAQENRTGFLPPLKTRIAIKKYDTIFVGFPTWGMKMPPPMKSFLKQYNLSGKMIIPFNTHGGYGVGSGFRTVKELCPKSTVLEGFSIKGGIERDGIYLAIKGEQYNAASRKISSWLDTLGITVTNK